MAGGAKEVFERIGHGIAWPFTHGVALIEFLNHALKDEPKVKALIVGLLAQIAHVSADGAIVFETKGLSIPADLEELAAAKMLWEYVVTQFLPGLKEVYGDLAPIVDDLTASAGAAPASLAEGPGLHTQVPA